MEGEGRSGRGEGLSEGICRTGLRVGESVEMVWRARGVGGDVNRAGERGARSRGGGGEGGGGAEEVEGLVDRYSCHADGEDRDVGPDD